MKMTDLTRPGIQIKNTHTRSGKPVLIRNLTQNDSQLLLKYANKLIAEDTFVMLSGKKLTKKHEDAYVKEAVKKIKKGEKVHLLAFVSDEFAGSFEIRILERRSTHVGEIGISLIPEFRGDGLGLIAMETLIESAQKLGLKLLTLSCFAINSRAVNLYEKVGFGKAGVIPGRYFYRGRYEDELIMYKKL